MAGGDRVALDSSGSLFKPVQGLRLYQRVVSQIIDLIRSGHLRPGDQLPPERELADRLGVSRAVLREACSVLESRGILRTRHGGGRFLREVPLHEALNADNIVLNLEKAAILDVLEVRVALETQSAALAAERATQEEIAEMESLCRLLSDDFSKYQRENGGLQFHHAVARATHNFVMDAFIGFQSQLLDDLEQRRILGVPLWRHLNFEHVDILKAIQARDRERAQQLMKEHLEHLRQAFERSD